MGLVQTLSEWLVASVVLWRKHANRSSHASKRTHIPDAIELREQGLGVRLVPGLQSSHVATEGPLALAEIGGGGWGGAGGQRELARMH